MSAKDFEDALSIANGTDSIGALYRLTQCSSNMNKLDTLLLIAGKYLQAFCDTQCSRHRRRWIGLVLWKLVRSKRVLNRIKPSVTLIGLGSIILREGETEEIRIIAGLLMRQALNDGVDFASLWPVDRITSIPSSFPLTANSTWLGDFQVYLSSLANSSLVAAPATDYDFLYGVALSTTDNFEWADSGAPFRLIVDTDAVVILILDTITQDVSFVDVPLQHIAKVQARAGTLAGSQTQLFETRFEPWELVLDLQSDLGKTYQINASDYTGSQVIVTFATRLNAHDCMACIKEALDIGHSDCLEQSSIVASIRSNTANDINSLGVGSPLHTRIDSSRVHFYDSNTGECHALRRSTDYTGSDKAKQLPANQHDGVAESRTCAYAQQRQEDSCQNPSGHHLSGKIDVEEGPQSTLEQSKVSAQQSVVQKPIARGEASFKSGQDLSNAQVHEHSNSTPGVYGPQSAALSVSSANVDLYTGTLSIYERLKGPHQPSISLDDRKLFQYPGVNPQHSSLPKKSAAQGVQSGQRRVTQNDDNCIVPVVAELKSKKDHHSTRPVIVKLVSHEEDGDTNDEASGWNYDEPIKKSFCSSSRRHATQETRNIVARNMRNISATTTSRFRATKIVSPERHPVVFKLTCLQASEVIPKKRTKSKKAPTNARRYAKPIYKPVEAVTQSQVQKRHASPDCPFTPDAKRVRHSLSREDHEAAPGWPDSTPVVGSVTQSRSLVSPSSPCHESFRRKSRRPSTRQSMSRLLNSMEVTGEEAQYAFQDVEPFAAGSNRVSKQAGQTPIHKLAIIPTTRGASSAQILSSNSKPLPASPHAESTAISGYADSHEALLEMTMDVSELAQSNPFQTRPNVSLTAFIQRLTDESALHDQAINMVDSSPIKVCSNSKCHNPRRRMQGMTRDKLSKARSSAKACIIKNSDTKDLHRHSGHNVSSYPVFQESVGYTAAQKPESPTLRGKALGDSGIGGEYTLPFFENGASSPSKARTPTTQSSPPDLAPPSSHSSTSHEAEDQEQENEPHLPSEELEELEWEQALDPRQRDIHDQLIRISKRVVRHVVDSSTAVSDIVQTHANDGQYVLQKFTRKNKSSFVDIFSDVDNKKKDMQAELRKMSAYLQSKQRQFAK